MRVGIFRGSEGDGGDGIGNKREGKKMLRLGLRRVRDNLMFLKKFIFF